MEYTGTKTTLLMYFTKIKSCHFTPLIYFTLPAAGFHNLALKLTPNSYIKLQFNILIVSYITVKCIYKVILCS